MDTAQIKGVSSTIRTTKGVLGENANILMSDPGVSYKDIDGIMLRIMGVTWFDHDIKEDRKYEKRLNGVCSIMKIVFVCSSNICRSPFC